MSISRLGIVGLLTRFAAGLRFPYLFFLFAVLLGLDIVIPDPVPFADEILLGLGTLMLTRWRKPTEKSSSEERTD